jgi:hypothetical protein
VIDVTIGRIVKNPMIVWTKPDRDGVRWAPVYCWCGLHMVMVPAPIVAQGRTLACSEGCG